MSRKGTGPQSASSRTDLPLLDGAPPRERADAARNRLRVLAAAERLFAARGVEGVTVDDIAAEAGVGKGTVYRGFTDKAGLALALLSERGRELQRAVLSGEPPLGPGAPPASRLGAFVTAYLAFQAQHLDLVELSEGGAPGARLSKGSYAFWRQHCALLITQAGGRDAGTRAEALLAALSAQQVRHWVQVQGRNLPQLAEQLERLAGVLAAADGGGDGVAQDTP